MARKRHTAEQTIIKLREAEVGLSQGQLVGRVYWIGAGTSRAQPY